MPSGSGTSRSWLKAVNDERHGKRDHQGGHRLALAEQHQPAEQQQQRGRDEAQPAGDQM